MKHTFGNIPFKIYLEKKKTTHGISTFQTNIIRYIGNLNIKCKYFKKQKVTKIDSKDIDVPNKTMIMEGICFVK